MGWSAAADMTQGVVAGQPGGGWEIRTPEGLHPTRFPSLWTGVRGRSASSVTSATWPSPALCERTWTRVNETRTETRHRAVPGGRAAARWCAVSVEAISWALNLPAVARRPARGSGEPTGAAVLMRPVRRAHPHARLRRRRAAPVSLVQRPPRRSVHQAMASALTRGGQHEHHGK